MTNELVHSDKNGLKNTCVTMQDPSHKLHCCTPIDQESPIVPRADTEGQLFETDSIPGNEEDRAGANGFEAQPASRIS